MDVTVNVDARIAEAKLRGMADRLPVATARGFLRGLDRLAGEVVEAADRVLNSPTGTLLSSIEGRPDSQGALTGYVGVTAAGAAGKARGGTPASRYAYLLDDQQRVIRPVRAKVLTVPTKYNLTGAGVPHYPTVAALEAKHPAARKHGLAWRPGSVGVVIGRRTSATRSTLGRYEPMFWLLGSVTVRGRNVLRPTVIARRGVIAQEIGSEIDRLGGAA